MTYMLKKKKIMLRQIINKNYTYNKYNKSIFYINNNNKN